MDHERPKTDNLSGIGDGAFYGLPYAAAQAKLDADVVSAIARLRDVDPYAIDELELALTSHSGVFADPHLLNSVRGVTAEEIAAPLLGGTLNDVTNTPIYDFKSGDEAFQVKEGTTAAQAGLAAAEAHPDVTLVTDIEAAQYIAAHGHDAIGLAGLEPSHIESTVSDTVSGIEVLSDIAIPIPMLSAVFSALRELKRSSDGEIGTTEAIANVSVHVGSRAAGMALFLFAANAVLAVPTGGAFPVAVTVLGALAGGMFGKGIVAFGLPGFLLELFRDVTPPTPVSDLDIAKLSESARIAGEKAGLAEELVRTVELKLRAIQARNGTLSSLKKNFFVYDALAHIRARRYREQRADALRVSDADIERMCEEARVSGEKAGLAEELVRTVELKLRAIQARNGTLSPLKKSFFVNDALAQIRACRYKKQRADALRVSDADIERMCEEARVFGEKAGLSEELVRTVELKLRAIQARNGTLTLVKKLLFVSNTLTEIRRHT